MLKTLRLLNKARGINYKMPIQFNVGSKFQQSLLFKMNYSLFCTDKKKPNQQSSNQDQKPQSQPNKEQKMFKIISQKQIMRLINKQNKLWLIPYYVKFFVLSKYNTRKYYDLGIKYKYFRRYSFKSKRAKIIQNLQKKLLQIVFTISLFLFVSFSFSFALMTSRKNYQTAQNDKKVIFQDQKITLKDQIKEILTNAQSIYLFDQQVFFDLLKNYTIMIKYRDGKVIKMVLYNLNPNVLKSYVEQLQQTIPVDQRCKFYFYDKQYTYLNAVSDTISIFLPFLSIAIIYFIFMKSSPRRIMEKMNPTGKKSYKIQSMKNITVKFKDVAGMEQAKRQITQFVDFLKNSEKYIKMGAKIPKGALLTGPPGTGKTMLAKACAGQAGVSFFYISGSQFVQMFVGVGASKVRDLFAKARQQAPAIIFIDQIDTIGKKRQTSRNQQKDSTLNQLLVQMDGFSSNQTVIVMAASNRKEVLDNALTRPGRFDRLVQVTLPDIQQRQEIFKVHLKPLKIDPAQQLKDIAKRLSQLSPGFSGADIANLCNEAAIIAARKKQVYIMEKDFEQASERVTAGYQKKSLVTPKTKKRVALHEAGHAVAGWFLRGGDPLVKLTIIPRSKGSLGYAQYLPKSTNMKTKQQLIDRVAIMLAGITSQEIFYSNFASGGSDDLQKVYQLTRAMVMQYGMGVATYNVTMDEQAYVRKQSQYLQNIMQEEVSKILEQAKTRAKTILLQKKQIVQKLAQALIKKETINQEDIKTIMGQRPNFQ